MRGSIGHLSNKQDRNILKKINAAKHKRKLFWEGYKLRHPGTGDKTDGKK